MALTSRSHKVAFVLGGANTLHDDLDKALSLVTPDTFIAANHAGRDFEGVLPHWVTLHTEEGKMPEWIKERKAKGLPDALNFWTSNLKTIPPEHKSLYRRIRSWDGSSGLLGVTVALHLGYERVILCGIPLDKKAEHYDYCGEWMDAPRYRHAWIRHIDEMRDKVKSFSGWTASVLGSPTRDWIYSE